MTRLRIIHMSTAGAVATLLALGLGAAPASAHPLDGTDPAATGCSSGSTVIYSTGIYNAASTRIADLEVKYSPGCGTNWVRVNNYGYGATAYKSISTGAGGFWDVTNDTATGWSYGNQVYAPGSACVTVEGRIHNAGTVIGSTGAIVIC